MYGMKKKKKMNKGGKSFPDLNKDGKITQADILMGRGVGKKKMMGGGMMYGKKKMMDGGNVSKGGNERLYPYGKTNKLARAFKVAKDVVSTKSAKE